MDGDTCKTRNMFPWVVGIIPMVANHGLAPRNLLEPRSHAVQKGPGSESDKVWHNSRLELHLESEWSWSRGTRESGVGPEIAELDQRCIGAYQR